MQTEIYNEKFELLKKHIIRHYIEFKFLTMTSNTVKTELVLHDLKIHIYFQEKGTVFIAYNIKQELLENGCMKHDCKSIELDFEGFFQMYETIFAYIRNFNNRQNAN